MRSADEVPVMPVAGPRSGTGYDVDDHVLSIAALSAKYPSSRINIASPNSSRGLSSADAQRAHDEDGPNSLTAGARDSEIVKFLRHLVDPLILMLLLAAALAFLAFGLNVADYSNVVIAGVLCIMVTLICSIAYYQERLASDVMARIKTLLPSQCRVVRDSELAVPAASLVKGDLVRLMTGNRVPADIRIIFAQDFRVEMSSLTGEPDAVECTPECMSNEVLRARNLIFSGSLVMAGNALGVIVRTGDCTMLGRIARLAGSSSTASSGRSTLQVEIRRVAVLVSIVALVAGLVNFIVALSTGQGILRAFSVGFVFVIIAAVPEGLPPAVSSVLMLSARRLAERRVLIKRIDIVETLSACTVICTDKTGTLTQNCMQVVSMWADRRFVDCDVERVRHASSSSAATAARTLCLEAPLASLWSGDASVRLSIGRTMSRLADGSIVVHRLGIAPLPTSFRAVDSVQYGPVSDVHDVGDEGGPNTHAPSGFTAGEDDGKPDVAAPPVSLLIPPVTPCIPLRRESLMSPPGQSSAHMPTQRCVNVNDETDIDTAGACNATQPALLPPSNASSSQPNPVPDQQRAADDTALSVDDISGTFQSFAGMSRVDWARANTFTRMVIVSGVNNHATYVVDDSQNDDASGSAVAAPRVAELAGDASDCALARYVAQLVPLPRVRAAFTPVLQIPFNSNDKCATSIVTEAAGTRACLRARSPPGGGGASRQPCLLFLKGAPERVFDRCSAFLCDGAEHAVDAGFRAEWLAAYERFGMGGQRVLGLAYKTLALVPSTSSSCDAGISAGAAREEAKTGLVFLGLVALRDPPRTGVAEAVRTCKGAGIRVIMVTGDHALTAEAIARDVNIVTLATADEVAAAAGLAPGGVSLEDPRVRAAVVSGGDLPAMLERDWDALLSKQELVFARTSPEQKLDIVRNLQRLGHIVAVTGDGTNDAPSLKAAQIGIAMGGPGTSDAAREAAAVVLLDNDFTSIVAAVIEGRTLFTNLRKLATYWLSHAPAQVWGVFIAITFQTPLPLTGLLILTVDLVQEQLVAISFAYEPTEQLIMTRPPRNPRTDALVDRRVVWYAYVVAGTLETLCCVFAFFSIFLLHGIDGGSVVFSREYWTAGSPDLVLANGHSYTAAAQVAIAAEARAAYYATLIGCQFSNLWNCKTQVASIFRYPLLANHVTLAGVAVMAVATAVIVYVPAINTFFGTAPLVGWGWTFWLPFAVLITAYNELSKRAVRHNPAGWWARKVQW